MTQSQDEPTTPQEDTSLDELNPEGVGGTVGAPNTFEPEEDEDTPVETDQG